MNTLLHIASTGTTSVDPTLFGLIFAYYPFFPLVILVLLALAQVIRSNNDTEKTMARRTLVGSISLHLFLHGLTFMFALPIFFNVLGAGPTDGADNEWFRSVAIIYLSLFVLLGIAQAFYIYMTTYQKYREQLAKLPSTRSDSVESEVNT